MRRICFFLVLGSVLPAMAADPAVQRSATPGRTVMIEHCTVSPLAVNGEAQVPAQEAGVIMEFKVDKKHPQVTKNQVLATIDDGYPRSNKRMRLAEYKAAHQKAESDVDERVAKAAWKAADFEYQKNVEAVNGAPGVPAGPGKQAIPPKPGVPGSVSATELKHFEFNAEHMKLAIEQAQKQQIENTFTRDAKQAEMEIAQEQIHRREVRAPIDGVVQKILPHVGEWVKPGDPIMRIVYMKSLQVIGYLDVDKYKPGDVRDRPVTVTVILGDGKEETFEGRIVEVGLEVEREREFQVIAEVTNRLENDDWLLRPGMSARMQILLH